MADEIRVHHDNGILALLLGGLIVWLWFKYGPQSQNSGSSTAEVADGQRRNTPAQVIPTCGGTGVLPPAQPLTASEDYQDEGRYIVGPDGINAPIASYYPPS